MIKMCVVLVQILTGYCRGNKVHISMSCCVYAAVIGDVPTVVHTLPTAISFCLSIYTVYIL